MHLEKKSFYFDSKNKQLSETTFTLLCAFTLDSYIFIVDANKKIILYNKFFHKFCIDFLSEDIKVNKEFPRKCSEIFQISKEIEAGFRGEKFNIDKEIEIGKRKNSYNIIIFPIEQNGYISGIAVKISTISQGTKKAYTWHSMLELSETISRFSTLDELYPEIYKIIIDTFGVKNFYIVNYSKVSQEYRFLFFRDESVHESCVPVNFLKKSLIARAIKKFSPILINKEEIEKFYKENKILLVGEAAQSWMGIPFIINRENIGAIVIQSYSAHFIFDHEDFNLLQIMSQHIGMAIGNKISQLHLLQNHEKNDYKLKVAQIFQWEYLAAEKKIIIDLGMNNQSSGQSEIVEFSFPNFLLFFIKKDALLFAKKLRDLIENQKQRVDMELQLKPNSQLSSQFTRFSASRFYDRFRKKNTIIGVFQDITELRINELKLDNARLKAEEADKLKSSFLANMSHEIRTPLNGILGFSRLLSQPDLPISKREHYINYIEQSGQNLLHLINDILDVAKIESGKFDIRIMDCELNDLLDEVFHIFYQQIESSEKIDLIAEKGVPESDFIIKTDPLRLRQVFNNLIGNALKFTEQGYIKYGYNFDKKNQQISFFVEDTGIGIPEDKKELIFSRFGKIEDGKVVNPGGTGLGLSIVKQIVNNLGGSIEVESSVKFGTRFSFILPYEQGHIVLNQDEKLEKLSPEMELKLLLVEDNEINQYLVVDTLESINSNVKIDIANNGKEAIEKLSENKYDIVLMDIQMPVMNGYQATEYIRHKMKAPERDIPIIGLSAHALKKEAEKCLALGMNSYLTKPFKPEVVMSEISRLLKKNIKTRLRDSHSERNKIKGQKMSILKLDTLKEMYENDMENIKTILKLYQEQIPKQLNSLEEHLKKEDWELIELVSHSIKGTLAYLGNEEIRQLALNIETNAKTEQRIESATENFEIFKNKWGLIFAEINEILT